mgnify:FL=1
MKNVRINLTLDKVANLYNKTRDEKYKELWYKMVRSGRYVVNLPSSFMGSQVNLG